MNNTCCPLCGVVNGHKVGCSYPNKQKRCFLVKKHVISCSNCLRNYTDPGFCQELSILINNEATTDNNNRGLECKYWLPRMPFSLISIATDEISTECYYEKDSMG